MKVIGILQPGYLPWLGFFQQMLYSDIFVIYDDVQYDKHGWRNRNRVKGPQGPVWLTVPVRTTGMDKPKINEVLIDHSQPRWARKHCATVRQLYGKAPYFTKYFGLLEELLQRPWVSLLDLDLALIRLLAAWLGLEPDIILSSSLKCQAEDPTTRLVRICQALSADVFYEGSAGRNYLDLKQFEGVGIGVVFQDYQCQPYPQMFGAFISHLSALDLLFNCGAQSWQFIPGLMPPLFT